MSMQSALIHYSCHQSSSSRLFSAGHRNVARQNWLAGRHAGPSHWVSYSAVANNAACPYTALNFSPQLLLHIFLLYVVPQ